MINRQSYDLELANSRTHRSEHGKNKRHDDSNNITSRNDNKSMNGSTSTGISPAVTTNHGKRGVAARVRPTIDVSGAAGNSSEYNSDLESGDAWSHTSSPMHEEDSPSRSGCDFFPSVGRQQRAKPLAALIQANSSMLAGNPSVTINSTTSPNVNLIQQSRNESIVLVSDNLKLHDISSSSRSSTGKEEVFSTTRNRKSSGCHNNSRSRSRSSDSNSPPNLFPVDSNDVSGVRTGTNLSTIRLDEEAVASSTYRGPSTLKDVNEEEEGEEEDPLRNVQLQVEEYEEDDIQELEPSTTGDLDIRDVRNRPERRTTHFMGDTSLLGSGSNHSSIDDLSSNIHIYNDNIPNSSIQGHMGTGSQVSVTGSHNNSSTASIQLYSTTTESAIYHFGHQLWLVFHCIYTPVQRVYRILLPSLHPQIPLFITGNVHIVALQNHSSHHRMQEGGDLIHQGGIVDMIESDSDDFDSDGCNEDEPEERQPMLHNMTHTSSNNSEKNRRNSGKKQKNQSKHPDSPVPPSHHNESSSVNSARVPMKRAFLVLFTCILCIGALATAIVVFSEAVIAELGFSSTTVGATFVALGAEIPDAVSAVAMAKLGYYDGAVAGAIGSQVINVSLGVGVPALIVSLLGNGFLTISQLQATSLTLLTCLLIFVIASYITVTVPIAKMLIMGQLSDNTLVYKSGAMFQITIWICVYAVFLYLNSDSNATTDNQ